MRIRASADPTPGVERRVLDGVERRIALGAAGSGASAASNVGGASARGVSAMLRSTFRWRSAAPLAAKLTRWSAIGLVAGAVGYQLGWSAHEREASADSDARAATAASGVAAPGSTDAAPLPPAEPLPLAPVAPSSTQPVPEVAEHLIAADEASPSQASGAQASPAAVNAALASSAPEPPPRATRPRERPARNAATPTRSPSMAFGMPDVLDRLQRAQAQLRDLDPHAALATLDALDTLERNGLLADERLVLRALALCDIGRVGEARRALAELEALGAGAIYRGRLEQSCAAALTP